jgi:hypothetical protein
MTAWLIAGSQRSRSSSRSIIASPDHFGPVTSSHRCPVVGGHRKLLSGGRQEPPPSGHGVSWPPVTSPERPGRRSPITRSALISPNASAAGVLARHSLSA